MALKYALLGLLVEGPLHGYELKTAYERHIAPHQPLNYGQVYTALVRLERDSWVEVEEVPQSSRPNKKVYSVTKPGRQELEAWLDATEPPRHDLRNPTFVKLALARILPGFDPGQMIEKERTTCFEQLQSIQRARVQSQRDDLQFLLLDLAALRLEAFLRWLDLCEEAFRKREST